MNTVDVQVTSDFICPWCWIGHRHLLQALEQSPHRAHVTITCLPFELNPDMPKFGVDRKAYRTAKFGNWARAQARDLEVAQAGARIGLDFRFDRVSIAPNTRPAHRLMAYANAEGDPARSAALFDAIFEAYFSRGEHIGLNDVLTSLAATAGFDPQAARAWLDDGAGEAEVTADELRAELDGIRAVPTVHIGRTYIQGAQPVAVFVNALDNELSLPIAHKG